MKRVYIYDTTLRDGSQAEDISFSVDDKLRITEKLDELGIDYIEGGWPASNPRDSEYFQKVKDLGLKRAKVVAFGSTHRPRHKAADDQNLRHLVQAGAGAVTIFGKTWDFHVTEAFRIPLEENLDIIRDSVAFLKSHVEKVFFDAEHFFDGFKANPEYALKCLDAAHEGGADCLVLCDTNGGTLPDALAQTIREVKKRLKTPFGIHAHNDSECAVANSLIAVGLGAVQVHGTINGYGERCGNANLCSVIPDLELKMGVECVAGEGLERLREISRFVTELANLRHFRHQPFVGDSAFAHKAGIHVSAVMKQPQTYEHIRPELVGNRRRVLVSDLAGKSSILKKAKEFNIAMNERSPLVADIVRELKDLENQGYQFEAAEASFELLMKKALGLHRRFFDLMGFRVIVEKRKEGEVPINEATIMLKVGGNIVHTAATGDGPVNALDNALRKALEKFYPELRAVRLLDYKVRVLAAGKGTAANVRVLIESGDGREKWGTVGVSENIIEASYQALVDSIEYKLLKQER
ncbi:MAG: citramalate synthase [Nitrospiraceae bacterium]|nr:citramalate synthase [Nitrospiraceae bacterium]MDA8326083.1 citramalate synthase [Nitrospiraceae bacterium]